MKFVVSLERDEDGYFVAECLALPGCVSQGKSEEEALENVKEAIKGWIKVGAEMAKEDLSEGARIVEVAL